MKFYTIESDTGETLGCEMTVRDAHALAARYGLARTEYTITMEEVEVSAESVRLLLAQQGGYCKDDRQVWPRGTGRCVTE